MFPKKGRASTLLLSHRPGGRLLEPATAWPPANIRQGWDNGAMSLPRPPFPELTCSNCRACCCQLEVMLMGDDAVPRHLTREDEWGGEVMRRLEDGWCVALDRDTLLCKIYAQRPAVCREYEMGGHACAEERAHLDAPRPLRGPL